MWENILSIWNFDVFIFLNSVIQFYYEICIRFATDLDNYWLQFKGEFYHILYYMAL